MRKLHFKFFWCLLTSIVHVHRQVSARKHESESAPTLLPAQTPTCLHPTFKLKPTQWLTCKHSYILWKYIHLNVCQLKREKRHEAAILHEQWSFFRSLQRHLICIKQARLQFHANKQLPTRNSVYKAWWGRCFYYNTCSDFSWILPLTCAFNTVTIKMT